MTHHYPTLEDAAAKLRGIAKHAQVELRHHEIPTGTCRELTPLGSIIIDDSRILVARTHLRHPLFSVDANPANEPAGVWNIRTEFSSRRTFQGARAYLRRQLALGAPPSGDNRVLEPA